MTQVYANGTPLPVMVEKESITPNQQSKNTLASGRTTTPTGQNDHPQYPRISIVSLNLLAPLYVRPLDKRTGCVQPFAAFEWVQDDDLLDWELRKHRLLHILTTCQADVICVQELQLERNDTNNAFVLPSWLTPLTTTKTTTETTTTCGLYTVILPPPNELEAIAKRNVRVLDTDAAVTCAVFVKTSQIGNHHGWMVSERNYADTTTTTTALPKNTNTCVSVRLDYTNNNNAQWGIEPIVVASVHLDATNEEKRISQIGKCLERANALIHKNNNNEPSEVVPLTAVIAGDMNAEFVTGSCMSAILQNFNPDTLSKDDIEKACAEAWRLSDGESLTVSQLNKWQQTQRTARNMVQDYCISLNRINTGPTRCAYDHNNHVTSTSEEEIQKRSMETWKLDHILYTTGRLVPLARWSTLEDDSESCTTGLPNHKCPSDHYPIACVFAVQPNNDIATVEDQTKQVVHRVQEISDYQKRALEDIESKMEAKLQNIMKKLNVNGSSCLLLENNSTTSSPKSKKKKKEKPPKEIMEFQKERRAALKAVKQEQEIARQQFIQQMGNMERFIIQRHLGIPWR
jgi:endonuclease/exonuclease/phosphatase family metal-dependent hydrolase